MARGGARPGAGRKKGSRILRTAKAAQKIGNDGMTPLEYLLSIMRDGRCKPSDRLEAAKAAAPYVHPRLAATELSGSLALTHHEEALNELDE